MKKVLLHICCGVCALYCFERLRKDGFSVEGFFFNPNIHPYFEYLKRRRAAEIAAENSGILMQEGNYRIFDWFKIHKPYHEDVEGGLRCESCYRMRLEKTMALCCDKNYDYFTTTLTISPHKKSSVVFKVGSDIGKDKFLAIDFKKKDGFKRTIGQAKKLGIYRQGYCGCVYSKNEREIPLIQ
ncbi:MAG: epoxyqueuosine reductase QueH [Candidatus Omnitrophica bacterium]|nr:epoxyqueuosine reductase QueH [Candidatus Omnitrophota bacterium]